ncbi:MAG: hypothetical protein LC437_04735 [Thiohalomonas sp.]|nr:hypothetical protein [Thiohalomonas sp.]
MSHNSKKDNTIWIYDIETYPNCFIAVFKELCRESNGKYRVFQDDNLKQLKQFLSTDGLVLIGYNNFRFDDVVLKAIIDGNISTASEIYNFATRIIEPSKGDKEITRLTHFSRKEWGDRTSSWGCIDLFQILGGKRIAGSLKSHEVRLGLFDVKDLPFKPGTVVTSDQITNLIKYCKNDVNAIEALYFDIESEVEVRVAVNQQFPYLNTSALRQSNSSIAETVMKREMEIKAGINLRQIKKPEKFMFNPAFYIDPAIKFITTRNQQLLEQLKTLAPFDVTNWLGGLNDGYLFHVGNHKIDLGKGGAHTIISHLFLESENIIGYDVSSYYPSLLRRLNSCPGGLTLQWLDILNGLTDDRIAAKSSGDQAKAVFIKSLLTIYP